MASGRPRRAQPHVISSSSATSWLVRRPVSRAKPVDELLVHTRASGSLASKAVPRNNAARVRSPDSRGDSSRSHREYLHHEETHRRAGSLLISAVPVGARRMPYARCSLHFGRTFSAMSGGVLDLYVWDLETRTRSSRLTAGRWRRSVRDVRGGRRRAALEPVGVGDRRRADLSREVHRGAAARELRPRARDDHPLLLPRRHLEPIDHLHDAIRRAGD